MIKVYKMGKLQLVQSILLTRAMRPKARTKYRAYNVGGTIIKTVKRK